MTRVYLDGAFFADWDGPLDDLARFSGVETERLSIERDEEAALSRIEAWRDAQEKAELVFEHDGRRWDGGLASRERLTLAISMAAAGVLPTGFFWTDADNLDVPMQRIELEALRAAMDAAIGMQGFRIHARQRELKASLAAMSGIELLEFEPGW